MRPMVLDKAVEERLEAVRKHAEAHPFDREAMERRSKGIDPPPGDSPEFVAEVPVGFRFVFTVEEVGFTNPNGPDDYHWCKHLSVSVPNPFKLPHPKAVEQVLPYFGMTPFGPGSNVWGENAGTVSAMNILERIVEEPSS